MITGFMGIAYSTDEIKNGRFVDRTLEQDFLQTRYDILRRSSGQAVLNESVWKANGVAARKQFLKMMESASDYEEQRFDLADGTEEVDASTIFTYDGTSKVPNQLTTAIVGDSVSEIQDGAFKGCLKLKSIVINENLKRIGQNAFEACVSLDNLKLGGVNYIGDNAFLNCIGLVAVELGPDVQHIGMGAFKNCSKLGAVNIPPNVTFIGDYAFANCQAIKTITVPDGVTTIPSYCFQNCTGLEQVILPSSIEKVGEGAFENCPQCEVLVPSTNMEEVEELLGVKMVAKAEDDPALFRCDQGYMVRLYKDLYNF